MNISVIDAGLTKRF